MSADDSALFVDAETGHVEVVLRGEERYQDSLDWMRFHGIDPNIVPCDTEVVRDAARCRVTWVEFLCDDHGEPVLLHEPGCAPYITTVGRWSQGEAPPLPWPWVSALSACTVRRDPSRGPR